MRNVRVTIWVMVVVVVGAGQIMAAITVLDFEALADTSPGSYASISEDGFTLSSPDNIQITGSGFPQPDGYKGSATASTYANSSTYLVKDDSGSFDLTSIDLARFSDNFTGSVQVNIIGYDDFDNQVTNQLFTLPAFGDESLHTYALDSTFSGIYMASWRQEPDYFQFDNIVLTYIPEPTTLLLLGLGGLMLRRKR